MRHQVQREALSLRVLRETAPKEAKPIIEWDFGVDEVIAATILYAKWTVIASTPSNVGTTASSDKVTSSDGTLTLPVGKSGEVSLDERVKIVIPAGAFVKDLKITVQQVSDTQKLLTSKDVLATPVYEILKNFTENFDKDIALIFIFDPELLEGNLIPAVFYYDETKKTWVKVEA